MKDSVHFNIEFIAEVEKHPELYDYTLGDYANRSTTQATWEKIAEKFNETAHDCRSKWKSIRSAYIRSLHNSTPEGSRKQYYLANSLEFLTPYAQRTVKGRTVVTNEVNESETEELNIDQEPESQQSRIAFVKQENTSCQSPIDTASRSSNDSPPPLKRIRKTRSDNSIQTRTIENRMLDPRRDSCEMFLLSLLPHMESMSQPQQLSLKKQMLELIENVKYG